MFLILKMCQTHIIVKNFRGGLHSRPFLDFEHQHQEPQIRPPTQNVYQDKTDSLNLKQKLPCTCNYLRARIFWILTIVITNYQLKTNMPTVLKQSFWIIARLK